MTTTIDRKVHTAPPGVGPITGHRDYGCRCYDCGQAHSAWASNRRQAILDGTWKPFVDPQPVLDHVAELREAGMSITQIATQAKVGESTLSHWVKPGGTRAARMKTDFAEAVLSVAVGHPDNPTFMVAALGTHRRIQALVCLGWSLADQGRKLGISRNGICKVLTRSLITPTMAAKVSALFEELSATPQAGFRADRARRFAQQNGWVPPLAWDDLDDPTEQPSVFARGEKCVNGHEYDLDNNRYVNPHTGKTSCRTCLNASRARYEQSLRVAS